MAWTGWRCSARPACGWRPPRRAAIRREIIPGSCSPELRHAIQGWATRWPGGRSSWSAAEDSLSVPPGEIAGAWLIRQNLADLFIGYAHYGPALAACDDLRTLTIPAPWNIRCDYQLARLRADPAALALYRFILGDVGQGYLRQAGFMPFSDAA
nr:substrate-binding domain-containing protein [Klebsiella pneumoniae]